jgi:ureidoglycolate lyase
MPFLVIVAADLSGDPDTPRAFLTEPRQGVNIAMNVWHGVLTPLHQISDFLVVDRGGEGNNLEEHHFDLPHTVLMQ